MIFILHGATSAQGLRFLPNLEALQRSLVDPVQALLGGRFLASPPLPRSTVATFIHPAGSPPVSCGVPAAGDVDDTKALSMALGAPGRLLTLFQVLQHLQPPETP